MLTDYYPLEQIRSDSIRFQTHLEKGLDAVSDAVRSIKRLTDVRPA